MSKNQTVTGIVALVVVAGISFWGGMQYGGGSTVAQSGQRSGQFTGRQGGFRASGNGGAFGTIVSKDANSLTVQLGGGPTASSTNGTDTGSKIVILDSGTQVGKFVTGSQSDLTVGESVMVQGTPNSDGSITATSVQIRPARTQPSAPPAGQ